MKKLKFILLLTVLLTTFSCQSGKQKVQSKEEKSINEFVAHLTEVDTVLITNLINQFMVMDLSIKKKLFICHPLSNRK
jgi:hypothetical protein